MAEPTFTHRRTVEFVETDTAGIAHFSNFFRWMEAAEGAWLKSVGIPVIDRQETAFRGWPRVRASAKYHEPVYFHDELEIEVSVTAFKPRAIEYSGTFHAIRKGVSTKVATVSMTTVYVEKQGLDGTMKSLDIPLEFARRLGVEPVV